MSLDFNDETFRNDFTFKNSARAIKRFPFPFPEDSYMYSVNMEPHVPVGRGLFSSIPLMWMNITSLKCATARWFWPTIRCAASPCRI